MIQGTEMKALCSLVFCQSLRKIYRMMGNYQPSPSNKLWLSTAKKLIINEEENTEKNLEFQIGIEPSTFRTQKIIHVKTKNRSKWMLEVKHPCKRVQINKSDVFSFKASVRIKTFLLPVIEANSGGKLHKVFTKTCKTAERIREKMLSQFTGCLKKKKVNHF